MSVILQNNQQEKQELNQDLSVQISKLKLENYVKPQIQNQLLISQKSMESQSTNQTESFFKNSYKRNSDLSLGLQTPVDDLKLSFSNLDNMNQSVQSENNYEIDQVQHVSHEIFEENYSQQIEDRIWNWLEEQEIFQEFPDPRGNYYDKRKSNFSLKVLNLKQNNNKTLEESSELTDINNNNINTNINVVENKNNELTIKIEKFNDDVNEQQLNIVINKNSSENNSENGSPLEIRQKSSSMAMIFKQSPLMQRRQTMIKMKQQKKSSSDDSDDNEPSQQQQLQLQKDFISRRKTLSINTLL